MENKDKTEPLSSFRAKSLPKKVTRKNFPQLESHIPQPSPALSFIPFAASTDFYGQDSKISELLQKLQYYENEIKSLKIHEKEKSLALTTEIFDLKKHNFDLSSQISLLTEALAQYSLSRQKLEEKQEEKKKKTVYLYKQIESLKAQYSEDLNEIQVKASENLKEIVGKYEEDVSALQLKIKGLREEIDKFK